MRPFPDQPAAWPAHAFVVSESSRPDRPNEDAAIVRGPVAVLVDGAGVPERFRAGCSHSVAWFAHALAESLAAGLDDPEIPMRSALAAAIVEVRGLHEATCDLERGGPSGTVVAVRARDDAVEHLVLCDSSLLLTGRDGRCTRICDRRVEEVVAQERSAEAIEARRNRPGGFWVARHETRAADEALVGSVPRADLAGAALVSDGVTRAVDLLGLCDDAAVARSCRTARGASELIGRIRENEDSAARRGKLTVRKVHDDATVVSLMSDSSGLET